jgi:putative transposase
VAKKKVKTTRSLEELRALVSDNEDISVRNQCELLGINRSGIYYQTKPESAANLSIMDALDKEHLEHPTHGVMQLQDYLFTLGFLVNHKKVRRLMKVMRIEAQYPKRNLSKLGKAVYIHPYLLRGLSIERANQVWSIDITYIAMQKGFMYLTAIIDVYSRYIVGWALHNTLQAENVKEVLEAAVLKHGKPEIINSDQGSQFTCPLWIEVLKEHGIRISMDGRRRAIDNIYIERFWRTIKQDYVYMYPCENGLELYKGIKWFIEYYNTKKFHQGIDRQTPESRYLKPCA